MTRSGLTAADEQALVERAWAARQHAVAPFSGFQVGAALALADGQLVGGCNVENATLGLTMCAERVALFKALSEGARPGGFLAVAVVTESPAPTPPCGSCRQLLWEFCGDILVLCVSPERPPARYALRDLLPHAFDSSFLARPPAR